MGEAVSTAWLMHGLILRRMKRLKPVHLLPLIITRLKTGANLKKRKANGSLRSPFVFQI
jgi:hypothetical protein